MHPTDTIIGEAQQSSGNEQKQLLEAFTILFVSSHRKITITLAKEWNNGFQISQ